MDTTTALILLAIAVINAFSAWQTSKTRSSIDLLEKNTNSIKDALVAATAKGSLAEGKEIGRADAKAEQAIRAEGLP